jgi:hypothetical protein
MLLGQIVAISFASNLFNIVVACSPQQAPSPAQSQKKTGRWTSTLLIFCLALNFVCIYLVPFTYRTPYFLLTLGIPHILLFVPLYVLGDQKMQRFGSYASWAIMAVVVGLFAKATQSAYATEVKSGAFARTLFEHPAVSSVGWDVIFCHITIATMLRLETW